MLDVEVESWKQQVGLGLRLRYGRARLQAADQQKRVPPIAHLVHNRRHKDIHFCAGRKNRSEIEARRKHPRHHHGRVVQRDRLPHNRTVSCKLTLPEVVTQHHCRPAVLQVFFGREQSPQRGLDAQSLKEIARHHNARHGLRFSAPGQLVVGRTIEGHVRGQHGQRMGPPPILFEGIGGVGHAGKAATLGRSFNPHQPLGNFERQRPQQDGIHHAENCAVRADAQAQNQHRHHCKSAVPPQGAKRIANVLLQSIQRGQSSRFRLLLFPHV